MRLVPLLRFDDGTLFSRALLDHGANDRVVFSVEHQDDQEPFAAPIGEDGWVRFSGWQHGWRSLTNPCGEVGAVARATDLQAKLLGAARALGLLDRTRAGECAIELVVDQPVYRPTFLDDDLLRVLDPGPLGDPLVRSLKRLIRTEEFSRHLQGALPYASIFSTMRTTSAVKAEVGILHRLPGDQPLPHYRVSYTGLGSEAWLSRSDRQAKWELWSNRGDRPVPEGSGRTLAQAVQAVFRRRSVVPASQEAQWWAQNARPCELHGPLAQVTEACLVMDVPNPAAWTDERLLEELAPTTWFAEATAAG